MSSSGGDALGSTKVIYALVGLPARGKSYLSAKIVGYFNWLGISSKVFNAGRKRRTREGASTSGRAEFFENNNSSAVSKRDQIAMDTLNDALLWLENENGVIAVFDATNTTKERRKLISDHIKNHSDMKEERISSRGPGYQLIFIESICNDETVLENNLLQKVLHSPDFQNMELDDALRDLKNRIRSYEDVYETVEDQEELSYIKVIDLANKMICYRIWDSIPLRTVQLLMSCHIGTRPVYLVRSGQCEDIDDLAALAPIYSSTLTNFVDNSGSPYAEDTLTPSTLSPTSYAPMPNSFPELDLSNASMPQQRLRAQSIRMPSALTCNAMLNSAGKSFALVLSQFISHELSLYAETHPSDSRNSDSTPASLACITSTLPRAVETAAALPCFPHAMQHRSALGILDTGIYHGMPVESIRSKYPEEYRKWKLNPFVYRFAGGESIADMNRRLSDTVLEIERYREPVVIVSHLSPIQSLVAYFTCRDPKEIPLISVPQHAVVKLEPSIYGWSVTIIPLSEMLKAVGSASP
jgi:6-phosphofructo-2-kinase